MRVGLIRHFPVSEAMPSGWMTAAQLHVWRERYECAEAHCEAVTLPMANWARCYSSDLKRAYVTAQALYPGEILQTPLLREVEIARFKTGQLLFPIWFWRLILRFAWMTGHRS